MSSLCNNFLEFIGMRVEHLNTFKFDVKSRFAGAGFESYWKIKNRGCPMDWRINIFKLKTLSQHERPFG